MPRTESVIPPFEPIALDVVDGLGSAYTTPGSQLTPGVIFRRGSMSPAPTSFYTVAGATVVTRNPGWVRRYGPGANQTHSIQSVFAVPIGADRSLIPLALRTSRRYVFEHVFETSVQLAGVRRFIGFLDDNVQVDTANGGVGVSSISTENGGAWTLKYYLTNGGALQTGASSGIVPVAGTPQAFQFIYRDSTAPQLLVAINGVLIYTLTGLAALPAADGQEGHYLSVAVGSTTNPGLGEVDYSHESRFYIQELDPMPAQILA